MNPVPSVTPAELVARARACLDQAHAPYSGFAVAAAVLDDEGRIFTGVNVENASYGLTMCAERVAVFAAITGGAHRIAAVAVTSRSVAQVPPCGACRQVLAEFCDPAVPVYCDDGRPDPVSLSIGSLLPNAFGPSHLPPRT
jgi:cytidine deaminase